HKMYFDEDNRGFLDKLFSVIKLNQTITVDGR
ncbi:MAG: hypothetical protein ACI9EW_003200, partial [Cellvibrionaceae bacterium]